MAATSVDRRALRTRHALLTAFNGLVLQRPYDEIRVGDVLARAAVGRSTFYEHFRNKDDVLRHSLTGLFAVLANVVGPAFDRAALEHVLEHFWENRRLARRLLRGSAAPHVTRVLAELIEARLAGAGRRAGRGALPSRLVALQAATAELGLIAAWLDEEARCGAATIASALRRSSLGLIATATHA